MGLIGYSMKKNNYPIAPVVLGLILGGMFEEQFRRAMKLGGGTLKPFYTSPIVWFFLFLVFVIIFSLTSKNRKNKVNND